MSVPELKPLPNQPTIIHNHCRWNNHPFYQDPETGKKFVGQWNPPIIPVKETDKTFQIGQETAFRPDIISYRFYGTPLLSWVLAYANDVSNPWDRTTGFVPGLVIRVPDITTIVAALTF